MGKDLRLGNDDNVLAFSTGGSQCLGARLWPVSI